MRTRPPATESPFNLLRHFTGAALAILVVVSIASGAAAVALVRGAFAAMERAAAEDIVEDLVAEIEHDGPRVESLAAAAVPDEVRGRVARKLARFDASDLTFLSTSGDAIARFGESADGLWTDGLAAAGRGRVVSRWESRAPWPLVLLGGSADGSVETYVPVRAGGGIVAVARLHRDLAATIGPVEALLPRLVLLALAVGLVVFGALWLLVRRADALLKRQHRDLEDAAEAVEARNRLLQELNGRKDDFYAAVSQDLHAPLLAVRDGLRLLADDGPEALNPFQRDVVANGLRCTEAALDMIENLEDMARIDEDPVEIDREDVDLVTVVRSVAAASQVLAAARSAELEVRTPDEPILIEGDRMKIVRVVSLLTALAIKQSAARPVTVTVEREPHLARLRVRDRGLGFDPAQLAALQDPENAGDALPEDVAHDLAIVRRYVERHDGSLAVDSEFGEGATFTVTLPLATVPAGS